MSFSILLHWVLDFPKHHARMHWLVAGGCLFCGNASEAQLAGSAKPQPELSIRGGAQRVVESDREFLEEVNTGGHSAAPTTALPRTAAPVAPPVPMERRSQAATTLRPQAPVTAPGTQRVAVPAVISEEALQRFVRQFLRASQAATPDEEMALYGSQVEYFDSGVLSRARIEKDQRKYYQRWPEREFALLDTPVVLQREGGKATVRYRLRYQLRRDEESVSGRTEHHLSLQDGPEGLKIVGIQERSAGRR